MIVGETVEVAVFSVVGDMAVSTSGKYRVIKGGLIDVVNFDSNGGATSDTEFDVWLNGSPIGSTIVIDQADDDDTIPVGSARAEPGDTLQIDLTAAGMHEQAVIEVVLKG